MSSPRSEFPRHDTGCISSRRRVYWPNSYFDFRSKIIINCSQNCLLNPAFDSVNSITHFPINLFIKESFQGFHIQQTLANCWIITVGITKGKFLVKGTFIDPSIFLPIAHSLPLISWSKSSNWLKSLLSHCLFLRVEIIFASTDLL